MYIYEAVAATTKEKPFIQNTMGKNLGIKLKPAGNTFQVYAEGEKIHDDYQHKQYECKDHSWQPVG